ncbi:hypothetical protein EYF80_050464 [Liparis tanakae]|uniref:Uncharacterized protein n=1 Tax=Liparis tanakae TaxID=230148 RepID=A0A4Z2FDQ3_9TELE|nr:hypothetical protein EYF80_050464 [Liparis tanakae]
MEAENGVAPTHGAHARRAPNVCSVFSSSSVRRKMSACVAWRALGFQRYDQQPAEEKFPRFKEGYCFVARSLRPVAWQLVLVKKQFEKYFST